MIFFLVALLEAMTANGAIDDGAMGKGKVPCNDQNKANCRPGNGGSHHPPERPCTKANDCDRSGGKKKPRREAEEEHGPAHDRAHNDDIHRRGRGGSRGGRGRGGDHDGHDEENVGRYEDTPFGGRKVLP